MDNKDYLAFVFKNLKGLEIGDKISLLTILKERVSKSGKSLLKLWEDTSCTITWTGKNPTHLTTIP